MRAGTEMLNSVTVTSVILLTFFFLVEHVYTVK